MRKTHIAIILLLSIAIVIFKYTWRDAAIHHLSKSPTIIPSQSLQDSEKIEDKKILAGTKLLHRKNDSLTKQLLHHKLLYEQSLVKVKLLEAALQQAITKDTTKNLTERLLDSDTIKYTIKLLMTQYTDSDSLGKQRTCELESVINNKNTEISLLSERLDKLKADFSIALRQQDDLQKDNRHLCRIAQRKNLSNKILKTGIIGLAGIATALFLQPHF